MGIKKVLTAVCCSGVTPFSSSTPPKSGYVFERNPSKVTSMQIKDVSLVRDPDSIAYSSIHTSVHFQEFGLNIIYNSRTSLVAQWLRIRLPMQGTWVQALVREDPTCRGSTKPVRHNC
ncbi:hypothetical protein J1605_008628 [Eschrichtius robustus]|uniref:Uncharacterized protein n=1 Tax=Eschrichtius robustus TaxID=9764 RepID=A0AB34GYN0_ESCRO|nr:hypothetical protein J1605_008628 [Eschrichtius robustus]